MYDDDLDKLEDGIRRLKVEYDIFFNGHRKKPPEDLKQRVERICKRLSEAGNMSFSQRFRYTTLVTRFYVFRDRWRRSMIILEQGKTQKEAAAASAVRKPVPAAPEHLEIVIQDPHGEEAHVRQLYDNVCGIMSRRNKHASVIPYTHFLDYISTRMRTIQEQTGCSAVVFHLALEEDSIKFTARAVTEEQP